MGKGNYTGISDSEEAGGDDTNGLFNVMVTVQRACNDEYIDDYWKNPGSDSGYIAIPECTHCCQPRC